MTNLFLYSRASPLQLLDRLGLFPEPSGPMSRIPSWCDEMPLVCNPTCNPRVSQALSNARHLREQFCNEINNNREPPEVAQGTRDGTYVQGGGLSGGRAWYIPSGDPCVDQCTCAHEERHAQDTDFLNNSDMWDVIRGYPSEDRRVINLLECIAYSVEVECLEELLSGTL